MAGALPARLRRRTLAPWLPAGASVRSDAGSRSAATYSAVIDQFEVETNARYRGDQQGRGETYCNILVWDVTGAMGAEVPHWVDAAGDPAAPGRGVETTANGAIKWLLRHGTRFGWRQVSAADAQELADRGCPVVAAWPNREGSGHLAVVRPGVLDENGPLVTQAGEVNAREIRAREAFPTAWFRNEITYFAHD